MFSPGKMNVPSALAARDAWYVPLARWKSHSSEVIVPGMSGLCQLFCYKIKILQLEIRIPQNRKSVPWDAYDMWSPATCHVLALHCCNKMPKRNSAKFAPKTIMINSALCVCKGSGIRAVGTRRRGRQRGRTQSAPGLYPSRGGMLGP